MSRARDLRGEKGEEFRTEELYRSSWSLYTTQDGNISKVQGSHRTPSLLGQQG